MTLEFISVYKTTIIKNVIYLKETKNYYIFTKKIKEKEYKTYYLDKKNNLLINKKNYTEFK